MIRPSLLTNLRQPPRFARPRFQPSVHVGHDCARLPLTVKNWTVRLLSVAERTQATLKVVWKTAMASSRRHFCGSVPAGTFDFAEPDQYVRDEATVI